MTQAQNPYKIQEIEISRINILNPRVRSKKIFADMVENIRQVGLKRPITISPKKSKKSGKDFDLVCGQGRIEAFLEMEQTHIPAIIIQDPEETVLLKSLVENLARRLHHPLDHLAAIKALLDKGYDTQTISKKTGLADTYVYMIGVLLRDGEDRLLTAVELGHLPLTVAIQIASSPEEEQRALQEAYENNDIRGEKLKIVQDVLEARRLRGKSSRTNPNRTKEIDKRRRLSGEDVLKIYKREVERKQALTLQAEKTTRQIHFITEALRQLFREDHFVTLLRAEGLTTMPKKLETLLSQTT
jgi:ParB family chromosome partitioning protein